MTGTTDNSVYAAPEADLEQSDNINTTEPPFHLTSGLKVVLFSILSFSLYSIVWFYLHWRRQKIYANRRCLPFLRALFNVFSAWSLFTTVKHQAEQSRVRCRWNPGIMATVYILVSVCINVIDNVMDESSGHLAITVISIMVGLITVSVILTTVQNTINQIYQNTNGNKNRSFSFLNWLSLVGLLAIWGMAILGLTAG